MGSEIGAKPNRRPTAKVAEGRHKRDRRRNPRGNSPRYLVALRATLLNSVRWWPIAAMSSKGGGFLCRRPWTARCIACRWRSQI